MPNALRTYTSRKILTILAVMALATIALVAGPLSQQASATGISVDSEATWRSALATLSADGSGSHVITITASFTMSDPGDEGTPEYSGINDLTIEGGGFTIDTSGTKTFALMRILENGITVTFQNVTVDGFATVGVIDADINSPEVHFNNSTFTNNSSTWDGGVIETAGDVHVDNSVFNDNHADGSGGAIHADGNVYAIDSEFSRNTAEYGGAVYSYNPSVDSEFTDTDFTDNQAEYDGGAIYGESAGVDVYGGVFDGNQSLDDDGGAIYTDGDDVYIEDATFTNNVAASDGGAVSAEEELTVHNSIFTSNMAYSDGGALESERYIEVYDSTFTDNEADETGPGNDGGALWSAEYIEVNDSTFTNNRAGGDGGAAFAGDSVEDEDPDVEYYFEAYNSTFTSNHAEGNGGGAYGNMYADSHESTWEGNSATNGGALYTLGYDDYSYYLQSTFVENTATANGGAVYAEYYYLETYFSTFVNNNAGGAGDHIYNDDEYIQTYGSIFAGADADNGCDAGDGVDSYDYNFDDEGSCSDDYAGINDYGYGQAPGLGALTNNGGPTETMMPVTGSALINAIPWADCDPDDEYTDQRGLNREDTGADVDGCDIGSVEIYANVAFVLDGTTVTVMNSGCSADEAVYAAGAAATAPPAGVSMPHGVFEYTLCAPWGADVPVTVQLNLPSPVNELWKLTDTTWSQVAGVSIAGTTVTYNVYDGGSLDEDGTVNGMIVDPVGPALGAGFTG